MEPITSYKGFDADWKCRGMQYAVGQSYEMTGDIEACSRGYHACEYPLDVLGYYPAADSRFAIVEQSGALARRGADTKVASSRITIKAEIGLGDLIKAAVEWTFSRAKPVDEASPAFSADEGGQAVTRERLGAASATGYRGAASATGDRGAASATGYRGAASATGYRGAASATGDRGAASATGDRGAASATGYSGAASATGKHGVAMACGWGGRAMAADGCAIFLARRNDDNEITHVRAAIAGRDGVKPRTWYTLDDAGEMVEVAS